MKKPRTLGTLVWRAGLHALALLLAAYVLYRGVLVIQLAAIAIVLAAAAEAPVRALTHRGWKRGLAIPAVVLGVIAAIGGLLWLVAPTLAEQATALAKRAPELLAQAQESRIFSRFEQAFGGSGRLAGFLEERAPALANLVVRAASGLVSFATGLLTVLALTAFLLASGPPVWHAALAWVPPDRRAHVADLGERVRSAVAGYIVGVLVVGLVAGIVTGVTLLLLGVPYVLPLAVGTALLGMIPYLGAIAAGILVVATTFLTAGNTAGWIAAAVFFAYQQVEGAVLSPLIQRRAISLNPLVVLFGLLLGLAAFGIWGAVIALPLLAAAKVLAQDRLAHRRERWRREEERRSPAPGGRAADARRRVPQSRPPSGPRPGGAPPHARE